MAYPDPYARPPQDHLNRRWLFITACIARSCCCGSFCPPIEAWFSPREAAERTVTARGDLAADEKATSNCSKIAPTGCISPPHSWYETSGRAMSSPAARHRLGLHLGRRRPRCHQLPRHPGCVRSHRQLATAATTNRAGGGKPRARHRCAQDRRRFQAPAARADRHQRRPQWVKRSLPSQPLRPGLDAHHRIVSALEPLVTREAGGPPSIT